MDSNQLYQRNIISQEEITLLLNWLSKKPKNILKLYDSEIESPNVGFFHKKFDGKGEILKKSNNIVVLMVLLLNLGKL